MKAKISRGLRTYTWNKCACFVLAVLLLGHFLLWSDEKLPLWLIPPFFAATPFFYLSGWFFLIILFAWFSPQGSKIILGLVFSFGTLLTLLAVILIWVESVFGHSGIVPIRGYPPTECSIQRFSVVRIVSHCQRSSYHYWHVGYIFSPVMGNMRGVNLNGADLRNFDFEDGWLRDVSFQGADLRGANLRNARLADADFRGANLLGAGLTGAYVHNMLINSNTRMDEDDYLIWQVVNQEVEGLVLNDLNLREANLDGAYLVDADLSNMDLGRANLSRANLEGANLSGSDLSQTNLGRANLEGANLSGTILPQDFKAYAVTFNIDTIWPQGFSPYK